MSFNGSGVFTRLYNWVTDAGNGIDITASRMDADTQDIANGLSTCILKDGTQTITNDIPFNNNKITGLKDPAGAQDAVNLRTLQATTASYSSGVGGTGNAITLTSSIAAYAAGQEFSFIVGATNTGSVTININGLGAQTIKKTIGKSQVNLVAGDLTVSTLVKIQYDGTNFQLMNVRAFSQGADIASATTINLDTATGDYVHVTGTTAITTITLAQGRQATVEFTGILTLTNGANLICLSGANITTAAGDCAVFRGEASGVVRMVSYQTATGRALVSTTAPVSSVFSRTGAVAATAGDYAASQVSNDSSVSGTHVSDALNTLSSSLTTAGLTVISTSTPTGVDHVDFTSIPATYRALVLSWNGMSNVNPSLSFQVTANLGNGLGSENANYKQISGSTVSNVDGTNVPFIVGPSQSAAQVCSGTIEFPAYQSGPVKIYSGHCTTGGAGSIGGTADVWVSGICTTSTGAIQGLRCYWSGAGNFDAGTITLYGVN